ncbi:Hypothetical predicted protein [Podarcis lilfordi]|uniref:Uncharacterized protein n=1 Tax=Podarcis lilfordi TaxID=74358 RepID=A0AA35K2J3_9SAUR|nr:Hypothetical predicted protein [Podarcis lilfordi]
MGMIRVGSPAISGAGHSCSEDTSVPHATFPASSSAKPSSANVYSLEPGTMWKLRLKQQPVLRTAGYRKLQARSIYGCYQLHDKLPFSLEKTKQRGTPVAYEIMHCVKAADR